MFGSSAAWAQSTDRNPFTTAKDVEEGKRLYRFYCVNCHGMDGASGRGARIATPHHRNGNSDHEMFNVISNGVPGTEMPGQWLPPEGIWKILSFVRTLEKLPAPGCATVPGEPQRGRALVFGKGGCLACHSVSMEGRSQGSGRLGPDLTGFGSSRSRAHLREALVEPGKTVAARWALVRVTASDGAVIEGIRMNEDGYGVHLLDQSGNIRSFAKNEIRAVELPNRPLMPAYGTTFTPGEMDDVLAFLCSLGGNR